MVRRAPAPASNGLSLPQAKLHSFTMRRTMQCNAMANNANAVDAPLIVVPITAAALSSETDSIKQKVH